MGDTQVQLGRRSRVNIGGEDYEFEATDKRLSGSSVSGYVEVVGGILHFPDGRWATATLPLCCLENAVLI